MEYKYNISQEEAKKRVEKERLTAINLLDYNSQEYAQLSDNDKKVIYHLCRSAFWIDKIAYQMQNAHNLDFYHYVSSKAVAGDEYSSNVLRLFLAQKSINSLDTNGATINLADGVQDRLGKNYYPEDLTVEEFHNILNTMLNAGKIDEIKKILSNRTIVVIDGKGLKAIDYVEYYKTEFTNCAKELTEASKYCDDEQFREYLLAQAEALSTANNKLDAKADMLWAKLTGKLEYTITRESYDDELTTSIFANETLLKRLEDNNITIDVKDSLGARVGIVNAEGTKLLNDLQHLNDIASKLMPYRDEYDTVSSNSNPSQVAVDVDLIALTGDTGAYRAGIVLAENLPNSDKLAIKLGGGRRNVYHRQVRQTKSSDLYKTLLSPDFVKYYNLEADHWATIEHENTHSLGPKDLKSLGEYASILEEYKADMGMHSFLREYEAKGVFTTDQIRQIMTTDLYSSFLKAKPKMTQAHRVRSVMITNRLLSEGAIIFANNQLSFDFDKVIDTCKTMLAEVVRLQLDKSVAKAKAYVDKYFVWTDTHEAIAKIIRANSKKLNGEVVAPIYNDATKDLSL